MTPERWKQIEDLYHAAYGQSSGERAAFLADACPGDEPLRREVQALLDASDCPAWLPAESALGSPPLPASANPGDLIGRALGGYHLERLLGSGGMGEVYLARDSRLGREVAIKVLPREFTSDPDRLARLEREARMLAALNHPNICGIYGFEEAHGTRFLVLELVEGETLAARLGDHGAPVPMHEALNIARQIAEALEAAHDRGVIHRDLKPSNIQITAAGIAKVVDFGLAKPVPASGSAPNDARAAGHDGDSRAGVVLGTAAYMSPEQARGLAVDKRTDIWAFGAVMFEMLTGQRPFKGETATDTLAAILHTEPDWRTLPSGANAALRRLLEWCLQKDRQRRLQSIADARVQIEAVLRGDDDDALAAGDVRASRGWRSVSPALTHTIVAWTVAVIAIIAAAAFGTSVLRRPDESRFVFAALPPPGASLATEESPVLSPDGLHLAFVAYDAGGTQRLYVGTLGTSEPARPLEKSEGASLPFWSPDSRSIGFFAQGHLRTIDIYTGGLRVLAPAGGARGGTWNRDGVIVYVPSPRDGPYRVSAIGHAPEPTRVPSEPGTALGGWFPFFLPDGRHFLEFAPTVEQPENSGVWVVSLDSGKRTRLLDAQSNAIYTQGHVLFWREGTLWAQVFDETTRHVRGTPRRVADAVGLNPVTNQGLFSASTSGTLAYFAGTVGQTELEWLDRDGRELGRPGARGVISTIALSPDDTSVVYDAADPLTATFDIWRLVFSRRKPDKLTFNPSNDVFPLWSNDGGIFFMSVRERPPQIYRTGPESAGNETRVFKVSHPVVPSGVSRDSKTLYYTATDGKTMTGDIWSFSMETGRSTAVVNTSKDERYGVPSPDGRWLAYVSNDSDTYQVNVRALDGTGVRRQISSKGGSQPQWCRDGREIVYMAPDRALMSVAIESRAGSLMTEDPRRLFRTRTKSIEIQGTARTYAIASDGQRFLVANATEEARSASIVVVRNWRSGLDK